MAARRSSAGRATGRETRVTSRMAEGGGEDAAPAPGMGMTETIGIVTAILLVVAILLTDYLLGKHYATGMFFN